MIVPLGIYGLREPQLILVEQAQSLGEPVRLQGFPGAVEGAAGGAFLQETKKRLCIRTGRGYQSTSDR